MSDVNRNDLLRMNFARNGINYFVLGRFSAFNRMFPIAGNLFHHSVEMFMKGALVRDVPLEKLRNIGHKLPDLWALFKVNFSAVRATEFDEVVKQLDRFEQIRYPDKSVDEGMEATLAIHRDQRVINTNENPSIQQYSLVLEDMDALVKHIFELARFNPQFYLQGLTDDARQYLARENLHVPMSVTILPPVNQT